MEPYFPTLICSDIHSSPDNCKFMAPHFSMVIIADFLPNVLVSGAHDDDDDFCRHLQGDPHSTCLLQYISIYKFQAGKSLALQAL